MSHERQKPVTQKYRDNYDGIFRVAYAPPWKKLALKLKQMTEDELEEADCAPNSVLFVDEIVGTTPYLDGKLVAKQEGVTYMARTPEGLRWMGDRSR